MTGAVVLEYKNMDTNDIGIIVRKKTENHYKQFSLESQDGDFFSFKGKEGISTGEALVYKILDGIFTYKVNGIFRDEIWGRFFWR